VDGKVREFITTPQHYYLSLHDVWLLAEDLQFVLVVVNAGFKGAAHKATELPLHADGELLGVRHSVLYGDIYVPKTLDVTMTRQDSRQYDNPSMREWLTITKIPAITLLWDSDGTHVDGIVLPDSKVHKLLAFPPKTLAMIAATRAEPAVQRAIQSHLVGMQYNPDELMTTDGDDEVGDDAAPVSAAMDIDGIGDEGPESDDDEVQVVGFTQASKPANKKQRLPLPNGPQIQAAVYAHCESTYGEAVSDARVPPVTSAMEAHFGVPFRSPQNRVLVYDAVMTWVDTRHAQQSTVSSASASAPAPVVGVDAPPPL